MNPSSRVSDSAAYVAAAVIGFLASYPVSALGVTSAGELILAAIGVAAAIRLLASTKRGSPLLTIGGLAGLTISGYLISDLWNHVAAFDSQRRIGGLFLFAAAILACTALANSRSAAMIAFLAGHAVGELAINQTALDQFDKRSTGLIVCFITVALVAMLHRSGAGIARFTMFAYGAAALFCLVNDDRANAGLMAVMCAFDARSILANRRFRTASLAITALVACSVVAVFADYYIRSDAEYRARRAASNGIRLAGWVTAVQAISESPVVGHGSWASPPELLDRFEQRIADWTGRRNLRPPEYAHIFDVHSALLQSWYEGGALGAVLFLYAAFALVRGLQLGMAAPDRSQTATYYVWALALWHLLFSPFSGTHRMVLAFAVASATLAIAARKSALSRAAVFERVLWAEASGRPGLAALERGGRA